MAIRQESIIQRLTFRLEQEDIQKALAQYLAKETKGEVDYYNWSWSFIFEDTINDDGSHKATVAVVTVERPHQE